MQVSSNFCGFLSAQPIRSWWPTIKRQFLNCAATAATAAAIAAAAVAAAAALRLSGYSRLVAVKRDEDDDNDDGADADDSDMFMLCDACLFNVEDEDSPDARITIPLPRRRCVWCVCPPSCDGRGGVASQSQALRAVTFERQ
jgi:hypothetical protein